MTIGRSQTIPPRVFDAKRPVDKNLQYRMFGCSPYGFYVNKPIVRFDPYEMTLKGPRFQTNQIIGRRIHPLYV